MLVGFPISCQPVTGLRVRILGARPSLGLLLGVPGSLFAPPLLPRALAEVVTLGQVTLFQAHVILVTLPFEGGQVVALAWRLGLVPRPGMVLPSAKDSQQPGGHPPGWWPRVPAPHAPHGMALSMDVGP